MLSSTGARARAIGETIKKARTASGTSVRAMAKALAVAPSSITRWEDGTHRLPVDVMERMAQVIGVPPSALLYPEGSGTPLAAEVGDHV